MKKALVPVIVIVIAAVVITFAMKPNTKAAGDKIRKEITAAMSDGKVVFVQLSSSGCVICRKMKPELEKIMTEYNSGKKFFVIDINVDSHADIASQFGVTGVPEQVLLSTDGEQIYHHTGYLSYDSMKKLLESVKS